MGGFRSKPGQRRTAELCDAWQTAGKDLTTAQADYEEANTAAREEFGRERLPFVWRVWVIPPFASRKPPEQRGGRAVPFWHGPPEELVERVHEAREVGVDEIILDTNWFQMNDGKDGWERQPESLAALVEAAHS
jgi:hypothetical protein